MMTAGIHCATLYQAVGQGLYFIDSYLYLVRCCQYSGHVSLASELVHTMNILHFILGPMSSEMGGTRWGDVFSVGRSNSAEC